jgi:AraC-like DNA-binding protein
MVDRKKFSEQFAAERSVQESYLLDCVRMGLPGNIDAALSSKEYLEQMEAILGNDIAFARNVFTSIWPMVVYVAVEGGLSELSAVREYVKYDTNLQHAKSVRSLLEINRRIYTNLADQVAVAGTGGGGVHLSPMVRKIHGYITDHIYKKLTVSQIASELCFSRSHLSHIYKTETGKTIIDQIQRRKILEAKRLLLYSALSISDIGYKLSFSSQSHFTGNFKKETGMTPHQYRSTQNRIDQS